MVVVHRAHGFRFVIYTSDHEPAHVHITGPGVAKVNLLGPNGRPDLIKSIRIKKADLRKLMAQIVEHQALLLEEWDRIHGNLD